ncbi:hypothetical protein OE88DRAFT_56098 [Heliocybe sulcata]|uniref:Uncharacterized protein n=1 Tax=Heliocybe sulcata TaxID=5364 RepID=A0A5C3NST0_9AGAM|nr:hypothetical protein OE88DRAFT_56098 [Heliocybe sulcata]
MLPPMATPTASHPFASMRTKPSSRPSSSKGRSIRRATSQLLPNIIPFPASSSPSHHPLEPPQYSPTEPRTFSSMVEKLVKSPPAVDRSDPFGSIARSPPAYHVKHASISSATGRKLSRKSTLSINSTPLDVVPSSPPGTRRVPINTSYLVKTPPPSAIPDATPRATHFADRPWTNEKERDAPHHTHTFTYRRGMKLHGYPKAEAPYMLAYNSVILRNELATFNLYTRLLPPNSPSFTWTHKKPPPRVLDLGCGHGSWVSLAARSWKGSRIIGLDLVDTRTDAWDLSRSVAESVGFTQHNFLTQPLPFPPHSFDFIRLADLTLAIPYDAWPALLEEVNRILAPGGQLEIIDDQLLFPYSAPHPASFDGRRSGTAPPTPASELDFLDLTSPTSEERAEEDERFDAFPLPALADDPASDWEKQAKASRDLEAVFENMLLRQYHVHPQPHEFLDGVLADAFQGRTRRVANMHLALPGTGQATGASDSGYGSGRSSLERECTEAGPRRRSAESAGSGSSMKRRSASMYMEPLTEPSEGEEEEADVDEGIGADEAGYGTPRKASHKRCSGSSVSSLPPGISAKAAGLLGLNDAGAGVLSPKAAGLLGLADTASADASSLPSRASTAGSLASSTSTRQSIAIPSKAAGLLGLSSPPPSASSASFPSPPKEPEGLVLWPGTFLPMSPGELDDAVGKNVHTLLGCKAAVVEYVAGFGDEVEEWVWEYERFRRRRFGLSPDRAFSDDEEEGEEKDKDRDEGKTGSSKRDRKSTLDRGHSRARSIDHRTEKLGDLTFVRAIRVWEAHKPAPVRVRTSARPKTSHN